VDGNELLLHASRFADATAAWPYGPVRQCESPNVGGHGYYPPNNRKREEAIVKIVNNTFWRLEPVHGADSTIILDTVGLPQAAPQRSWTR